MKKIILEGHKKYKVKDIVETGMMVTSRKFVKFGANSSQKNVDIWLQR